MSAGPVDVSLMVDPKHFHSESVLVDLGDNPVRTAARHPETGEFSLEWVPDPTGGFDERTKHELDDRGCDTFWQTG
jgi:hypothetical protein